MNTIMLSALAFAADQAAKAAARRYVRPGRRVEVIKDKLCLMNIKNKGAAYGLLAKHPKLLHVLTAAIIGSVAFRAFCAKNRMGRLERAGIGLVLGGALGNYADRLSRGEVTDFLHIPFAKHAPVFNLADVFVLAGTVMCLFDSDKTHNDRRAGIE